MIGLSESEVLNKLGLTKGVNQNPRSEIYGFKSICEYYKTSNDWFEGEDYACPYCVHMVVSSYGTQYDKLMFNKNNTLSERYNIPITKKDMVRKEKKDRKEKMKHGFSFLKEMAREVKKDRKKKKNYGSSSLTLDSLKGTKAGNISQTLKLMRSVGIPIYGRGKRNLYKDIFQYHPLFNDPNHGMIYIKGFAEEQTFLPVVSDEQELNEVLKIVIEGLEDNKTWLRSLLEKKDKCEDENLS